MPPKKPSTTVQKKPSASESQSPEPVKKGMSTGTKVGIGVGACCCLIILIIILGLIGFAVWRSQQADQVDQKAKEVQEMLSQEQANWQTYTNSRYGFQVKMPKEFVKEESANGDGATFTQSTPSVTFTLFGVPATGQLDTYLSTVKQVVGQNTSVTEVQSSKTTLGNQPAEKRVWLYQNPSSNAWDYLETVIASYNGNFYSVTMNLHSGDYAKYKSTFNSVQKSFKFL